MTDFQKAVYQALEKIPAGYLTTYGRLGGFLKKPQAARAVGRALAVNPFSYTHPKKSHRLYPCHRVVRENGILGGFTGGWTKKIALLKKEGIRVKNGRVVDFEAHVYHF